MVCDQFYELRSNDRSFKSIFQQVEKFEPDIIYYRLVDEPTYLHTFAEQLLKRYPIVPLITHIMDDWPERLRRNDQHAYLKAKMMLQSVFERSRLNFSICDSMSRAFSERYGVPFVATHNFVEPSRWRDVGRGDKHPNRAFVVRYCGSLTPDMQLQSVIDVAKAIASLRRRIDIVFEIYVHERFFHYRECFDGISGTTVSTYVPRDQYKQLLASADILLLAANFDAESLSYIRYSMANKLPEYMISGTPMLVYGSPDSATVDYAASGEWAKVVTNRSIDSIQNALEDLFNNPVERNCLVDAARERANSHHSASVVRTQFQSRLIDVAVNNGWDENDQAIKNNNTFIGEYSRDSHMSLDESKIVFDYFQENSASSKTMIDVGAHQGSALIPFVNDGWRVHAFEPDTENRKILTNRYQDSALVTIDERAVSDEAKESMPFFTSTESTGISGLSAFHDTHKETNTVSTTTLDLYCAENKIEHVDFLLIDTEGYDFMVLKGFPWGRMTPDVIVCEFENAKTEPLGYRFEELADFLTHRGYTVLVSEWHPIIRYGRPHDWCRLAVYPCNLKSPNAWGNLIAFSGQPDSGSLNAIAARHVVVRQTLISRVKKQLERRVPKLSLRVFLYGLARKRHVARIKRRLI